MKVHYQCEFEVANPHLVPEYLQGIIDASIRQLDLVRPKTSVISSVEKIV